jgi:hypothetical protein
VVVRYVVEQPLLHAVFVLAWQKDFAAPSDGVSFA